LRKKSLRRRRDRTQLTLPFYTLFRQF
jgi:hypothetical protein